VDSLGVCSLGDLKELYAEEDVDLLHLFKSSLPKMAMKKLIKYLQAPQVEVLAQANEQAAKLFESVIFQCGVQIVKSTGLKGLLLACVNKKCEQALRVGAIDEYRETCKLIPKTLCYKEPGPGPTQDQISAALKLFLAHGIDRSPADVMMSIRDLYPEDPDDSNILIFGQAVINENIEVIDQMVEMFDWDPDWYAHDGWRGVCNGAWIAGWRNSPKSLRRLGELSADLSLGDGKTPAHLAALNGNLTCLTVLHEFGVDVNRKTSVGTPLEWARNGGRTTCAQFIESVSS